MHPDPLAAVLALLAYPALWTLTNAQPPTICQAAGPVCLIRAPHEVLVTQRDGDVVTITALTGPGGAVAWNEANLRVADAGGLRRDRAERARVEAIK